MLPANCASLQHNNLHRIVRSEPEKVIEKTTERASIKTTEKINVLPSMDMTGCAGDIPCGWALYEVVDGEKQIIDFMPNTCLCDKNVKQCVKTDENMSINAFVYRCRDNTQ
ncbi:unnamed protein product [Diamesa tonsa]